MQRKPSDVVIVGGGVIGCAIAHELSERGASVTLLERGGIGAEASWASAGVISVPSDPMMRPERIEIGRRGMARFPALVADLEERTAITIEYRRTGSLSVAMDPSNEGLERDRAEWQRSQGFTVNALTTDTARSMEPALGEGVAAAWDLPEVASLSVYRLTLALAASAKRNGATVLSGTPVGNVVRDNNRISGVRCADGVLQASVVVLAAGAWTRFLGEGVTANLPTFPVKGQAIAFGNGPVRPNRIIAGHGGYVRPRVDGTTVVAATEEAAEFDRRVTGDGIAWLLDLTRTLCPGLLQAEMIQSWSGLRPGSESGEPMIGPVPGCAGLWVASGHFRTGAREAPATAELVASSLVTGNLDALLVPFMPPPLDPGVPGQAAAR